MEEAEGTVPDYSQDGDGNRLVLPVMTLTDEPSYHVGTTWSPNVLKTGEQVTFINDFFDPGGTKKEHLVKYDFVIVQSGQEIHGSAGFSEFGADIKNFVFSMPGPMTIRFENVRGVSGNNVEFTSLGYQGAQKMRSGAIISSNKQDPTIIMTGVYAAIFGPMAGAIALWMYC